MSKKKNYVTVFLALLAGFAVLTGCAVEGPDNVSKNVINSMSVSDNPAGEIPVESSRPNAEMGALIEEDTPFDFDLSLPEGYRYYPVIIQFTNAESLKFLTYTTKDFPEINCVDIYYQSEGVMAVAKAQYEAEKTGDWSGSDLQKRIKTGMLMNLGNYIRIIDMIVLEESKESFVRAVNLLNQRNGIQHVSYPYWAEPGFKPVYGAFEERGLDAETEKQILQDWLYWSNRDQYHQWFLDSAEAHSIGYYGGTYNGSAVVNIGGNDLGMPIRYGVANVELEFPFSIHVWNSGGFYRLSEAYDLGLLTMDDIRGLPELLHITEHPSNDLPKPDPDYRDPSMPEHLCDYWGMKLPKPYCTDDNCQW